MHDPRPPAEERRSSPFDDDLDLAETATLGVRANLALGQPMLASALQPVARAAWALVEDRHGVTALLDEALTARARLDLACFAQDERRFLEAVIVYAATRAAPPRPRRRRRRRRRRPAHGGDGGERP